MCSGTLQSELRASDSFYQLVFSEHNSNVMISGHRGLLRVWHTGSLSSTVLRGHQQDILGLCMSSDGTLLCSTCRAGIVCCYDMRGNTLLWRKVTQSPMLSSPVYHNGAFVIASNTSPTVVYDAATGNVLSRLTEQADPRALMVLSQRKIGENMLTINNQSENDDVTWLQDR